MRLGKFGKLLHYDKTSLGIGNIKRFTIFEFKFLGGIIINIFNTIDQDRFHSHAFWAFSLMIRGWYYEDVAVKGKITTNKVTRSRIIPRNYVHKIKNSSKNAISVTFEGPWRETWYEFFDQNRRLKIYTWGREVLYDDKI